MTHDTSICIQRRFLGAPCREVVPVTHVRASSHRVARASASGWPCTGHLPEDGLVLTERLHELLGVAVLLLRLAPHTGLATCTRARAVHTTYGCSLTPCLL